MTIAIKPNSNYYFALTESGDRTNIRADFIIYDKTLFLAKINEGANRLPTIRYGLLGENVKLLKLIQSKEFNEIFTKSDFTESQMKTIFNKTIYESFYPQGKPKYLPIEELVLGGVYRIYNSGYKDYVYLGEVTQKKYTGKMDNNNIFMPDAECVVETGFGFSYCYSFYLSSGKVYNLGFNRVWIQKTIPKIKEVNLEDVKILRLKSSYTTLQKVSSYRSIEETTTLNQLHLCP